MVWYKELGFYSNPLSIKPALFSTTVVGYDLGEIFEKIDQNQIIFLEGKYGYGKTTILKHIIQRYGGKGQIAYYNCNRVEGDIDVENILKNKFGFFGKLMGRMPTDMILLLDEVESLSKEEQNELYKYYTQGNIKSVVFFGPESGTVDFLPKMEKLLTNNVIELTPLTADEAVELVRERVGDLKLITDKIVKFVFRQSEKNPRYLLENLEDICRYTYNRNEEVITEDHVREVLKIEEKSEPEGTGKKENKKTGTEDEPEDESEYFYY